MAHHGFCPLCNSKNLVPHARCTDHFLTGEEFELVLCPACGLIFTQDAPKEKDAGKYYESDEYISHNDTAAGFSSLLYRFSRKIMLLKKKQLVKRFTGLKTGTLLDIGSGTGYFLNAMKNAGWNTRGIEINDKVREFSTTRFVLDVKAPDELITLGSGIFDCITFWHALEHLQDPFTFAIEVKRLLKPDGICIAALPNFSSHDATHFGSYWAAYDVPRHLWHFKPDTFRLFCEKAGFKLTEIQPLPLDVFYISALSEKYKGSKLYFITGILKAVWFSLLCLFNKQRSSSLIYFLRK
jgi:2-polyprenyl-3-methyl-5-hydroxy-6-metoxy-1,4-benzoquinol methylase